MNISMDQLGEAWNYLLNFVIIQAEMIIAYRA